MLNNFACFVCVFLCLYAAVYTALDLQLFFAPCCLLFIAAAFVAEGAEKVKK